MTSSARLAAIRAAARPAIWRRGSAGTANPSSSPECRDAARRETAPRCRSAPRAIAAPRSAAGCRAASRPALAGDTRRALAPARGSPDRARDRRSTHRAGAGPPASPPRAHWRRESDPACWPRRPASRSAATRLSNSRSNWPDSFASNPSMPAHSISAEKTSRLPVPSGSSLALNLKCRNGPFLNWRSWVSQRFSCHSPNRSSHCNRRGPDLAVAARWMRPSASSRSAT